MTAALTLSLFALPLFGCGDDAGPNTMGDATVGDASVDAATDATKGPDARADGSACEPGVALVPSTPGGAGMAYAGHWESNALFGIRLDGDFPKIAVNIDLGWPTRALTVDPFNDRLHVVSRLRERLGYEARIYDLAVPQVGNDSLAGPQLRGSIEFPATVADDDYKKPISVAVDGLHHRMYVFVAQIAPPDLNNLSNQLRVYDVSDPANPQEIESARTLIPGGTYVEVDPYRRLLFSTDMGGRAREGEYLHVTDLSQDMPRALEGSPIRVDDVFPDDPDDSVGYQIRRVEVDFVRHRVFMVQSEATNSQLLGFEYPEFVPDDCESYADQAAVTDFTPLEDPFDVAADPSEVPNLIDAYSPHVDWNSGAVFLTAATYVSQSAAKAATLVMMSESLDLLPSCEDFEGFGCHYQGTKDGQVGDSYYRRTEGAGCLDPTYRVLATVDVGSTESSPGQFHLFKYDEEFNVSRWRNENGDNLPSASHIVGLDCHLRIP